MYMYDTWKCGNLRFGFTRSPEDWKNKYKMCGWLCFFAQLHYVNTAVLIVPVWGTSIRTVFGRVHTRAAAENNYKYVHLVRFGPKTGGDTNIKQKAHPTSPAIGLKRIVPVFPARSPGTPEFVYSAWLSTVFCRFLANQRPSIVPPYAPHTNADVRGDPPPPFIPHTTP